MFLLGTTVGLRADDVFTVLGPRIQISTCAVTTSMKYNADLPLCCGKVFSSSGSGGNVIEGFGVKETKLHLLWEKCKGKTYFLGNRI
jgi:hypothetical protein